MAHSAANADAKSLENDKELLAEASRKAAEVQSAMDALETHLRDAARLVAAAEKVNGVFQTVADRIANATFKATIDTTHGKSPREVAVSFVKELSELACMSLDGTRSLRREVVAAKASSAAVLPALRQAATAMQGLSQALKLIASRPSRAAVVPPPSIIVETRAALAGIEAPARQGVTEGPRVGTGFFPANRGPRRYSN
jgi:hypothetical protein